MIAAAYWREKPGFAFHELGRINARRRNRKENHV